MNNADKISSNLFNFVGTEFMPNAGYQVASSNNLNISQRSSSVELNNSAEIAMNDTAIQRRKLSERAVSNLKKVTLGEYAVGFGLALVGAVLLILNKTLGEDSSLQSAGFSCITGGIGILFAPVQSKMVDGLKKPTNLDSAA
ncbi:MAG: hypothetical protein LBI81_01905 [Puniceicoccales bacterium]|jgi:hypothetical protein|nr:hypothetical protein [Puniceicoccales bacterium]